MDKEIKYSVIIPVYNAEKTIGRCLDSLLKQGRNDIEIIVINDGSSDDSEMIIRKYMENTEQIVYKVQENSGVSKARNAGLETAGGKYITFVDSDDYVSEEYFQKLDEMNGEREYDLLVFSHNIVGGRENQETNLYESLEKCETILEKLELLIASRKIMSPCNKCFRFEIIKKYHLRFQEDMHIGEDFNFCMSYSVHCESVVTDGAGIYIVDVTNESSLSRRYRPYLDEQMAAVFQMAAETVKKCDWKSQEKQKILTILDYLFVKNTFTCIAEEFKKKSPRYRRDRKNAMKICRKFTQPLSEETGYYNSIHRGLRMLLRHKLIFPIYEVAAFAKAKCYRKYMEK